MKSKADKHREAGTLDQFRARQAASRAATARCQEKTLNAPYEAESAEREAFGKWRDDYSRHSDPTPWAAWQARAERDKT